MPDLGTPEFTGLPQRLSLWEKCKETKHAGVLVYLGTFDGYLDYLWSNLGSQENEEVKTRDLGALAPGSPFS